MDFLQSYRALFLLLILGIFDVQASICEDVSLVVEGLVKLKRALSIPLSYKTYNFSATQSEKKIIEQILSDGESNCTYNIETLFPDSIKIRYGNSYPEKRPNCWNTSLAVSKIVSGIDYTPPLEFTKWIDSDYCRPLTANEIMIPGDLLVIRSSEYDEVHGFTYIWGNIVFNKNSYSARDPYEFTTLESVLDFYQVNMKDLRDVRFDISEKFFQGFRTNFMRPYRCRANN